MTQPEHMRSLEKNFTVINRIYFLSVLRLPQLKTKENDKSGLIYSIALKPSLQVYLLSGL
jgi:hypothetical protein